MGTELTASLSSKDRVQTPYGIGEVQYIREDGVVVVLLENWKLATGASPVLYLQRDNVTVLLPAMFLAGRKVQTSYGTGTITEIRPDNTIVVSPDNWLLANNKTPLFYLNKESVLPYVASENTKVDDKGAAKNESVCHRLLNITSVDLCSQTLAIGRKVECPYGTGTVVEMRSGDNMVVVTPDKWLLANGKPPMFYLNADSVKLLKGEDLSSSSFESRMQRALDCKEKGTELFKEKDLEGALTAYGQALTIMNVCMKP
jgi:archaeosine-15-forming tRNA-guanine transglycosylase